MGEPRKRKREVITVEIDSDGDAIEIVDYDSDDEEDDIEIMDSDESDDDDIEIDIGGGLEVSGSRGAKKLKNTPQPKSLNIKIQTTPLISEQFDPDPELYQDGNKDKGRKQRVLASSP